MGDPKKIRKQYSTPIHPWQKARIDEEKILIKEYGLTNKKEIWRQASKVRGFARQAKSLIANISAQGEKERNQLISKLISLNILKPEADLDDVLEVGTKNLMERRLQTLVFKRGLAKSIKQARQLIVHGHIMVGGSKITVPSYLVKKDEEEAISFVPTSNMLKSLEAAPKKAEVESK
jgi:small subunit ribosomal protein S4